MAFLQLRWSGNNADCEWRPSRNGMTAVQTGKLHESKPVLCLEVFTSTDTTHPNCRTRCLTRRAVVLSGRFPQLDALRTWR